MSHVFSNSYRKAEDILPPSASRNEASAQLLTLVFKVNLLKLTCFA